MWGVMLTVFRHNTQATAFYLKGFRVSPLPTSESLVCACLSRCQWASEILQIRDVWLHRSGLDSHVRLHWQWID